MQVKVHSLEEQVDSLQKQLHTQSQQITQIANLQQSLLTSVPSVASDLWKAQHLGKLLFSASADRSIKLWNLETFDHLKTFQHDASVNKLLVNPKEFELVSSGSDAQIKIWNVYSGELLKTIQVEHSIQDVIWYKEYEYVITCGSESEVTPKAFNICVVKISTGKTEKILKGHTETVYQVLLHENNQLISCSDDQTIRFWNLETGKCIKTLTSDSPVNCMVKYDTNTLIVGCFDKSINIWNISTGHLVKTISMAHSSWIYCLSLFKDKQLISASDDSSIKMWDLASSLVVDVPVATMINEPHEKHNNSIFALKMVNNDTQFITGDASNIALWDIETRTRVKVVTKAHHNCIRSFAII